MKTFFISAGLVAVGAAGMQSVLADSSIPAPSPKVWSVSATLRGFYDDNYSIDNIKKGSFGLEFTPSVAVNTSFSQTDIGFRYTYGLYWYQDRQVAGVNPFDQSHQLDFWLDHAFNERWKLNLSDTVGVGQEPELIQGGGAPFRVQGDNIGNHFNLALDTQWTRHFSTSLHYENDFYYYQNNNGGLSPEQILVGAPPATPARGVSLAGLLNRFDQNAGLDFRWNFNPETMVFVGYSFDWVDYIANEAIGVGPGSIYYSKSRNNYQNQFYVGLQHDFTANIVGKVTAGAQYNDSYNDPVGGSSSWTPYAKVSLDYTYLPGSYVEAGFSQQINSTYVGQIDSTGLVQYQESSTVYASINHHFTQKLLASLVGQYVYSDFHGTGSIGPDVQYALGANLSYQFNNYLSADIGYNYDKLRSDASGGYERNRYYIGLTATY